MCAEKGTVTTEKLSTDHMWNAKLMKMCMSSRIPALGLEKLVTTN
jgi:hypothetical protein